MRRVLCDGSSFYYGEIGVEFLMEFIWKCSFNSFSKLNWSHFLGNVRSNKANCRFCSAFDDEKLSKIDPTNNQHNVLVETIKVKTELFDKRCFISAYCSLFTIIVLLITSIPRNQTLAVNDSFFIYFASNWIISATFFCIIKSIVYQYQKPPLYNNGWSYKALDGFTKFHQYLICWGSHELKINLMKLYERKNIIVYLKKIFMIYVI